jgi:hypothetical protein
MTDNLPADNNQLGNQTANPIDQAAAQPAAKEQIEFLPAKEPQKAKIVEIKEPEPEKELEGWLEKLEKGENIQLSQPVTDDYGQILVQAAAPQKPKIILPLDEQGVSLGITKKISESIRWLAEWCLRLIKMWPGRVEYDSKLKNQI